MAKRIRCDQSMMNAGDAAASEARSGRSPLLMLAARAVLLLAIVAVPLGCGTLHQRCAAEGQAAVEAFLRDGVDSRITDHYGTFVRLEGSGYGEPGWNIQGYNYISLSRTAYFSRRSVDITIHVTAGHHTAPGLKTIGIPKIQEPIPTVGGITIFVSHPDLK